MTHRTAGETTISDSLRSEYELQLREFDPSSGYERVTKEQAMAVLGLKRIDDALERFDRSYLPHIQLTPLETLCKHIGKPELAAESTSRGQKLPTYFQSCNLVDKCIFSISHVHTRPMMRVGRLLSPTINQLQILSGKYKAKEAPSVIDPEDEDYTPEPQQPTQKLTLDNLYSNKSQASKVAPFQFHMAMFKGVLTGISQLKPRYPTEFKSLDEVLGGGLSPRVPTMVMSLPHQGKTTFLHEVIASTLKNRMGRVLYLTTIDDSLVVSRRVSGITASNGKAAKPVARGGRVKIEIIYEARGLIARLARLLHSREHEEIVRVCKQEEITKKSVSNSKQQKSSTANKPSKLNSDNRQQEWAGELDTSDEEEILETLQPAESLQASSSGTRANKANEELNSERNGADDIDEALKELEGIDLNAMTSINGDVANKRKKKALNAVREYAYEMVVIDNLDHILNEVEKSWEHSMTYNRAAGALMREICQTLGIPIIVACQTKSKLDEQSLLMSPWPNFPGDVIHIERVRVKDEADSRKYVSKRLIASKITPFYMCRVDNLPTHSKLKFNMKVTALAGCHQSKGRAVIKTEKMVPQIPFSF